MAFRTNLGKALLGHRPTNHPLSLLGSRHCSELFSIHLATNAACATLRIKLQRAPFPHVSFQSKVHRRSKERISDGAWDTPCDSCGTSETHPGKAVLRRTPSDLFASRHTLRLYNMVCWRHGHATRFELACKVPTASERRFDLQLLLGSFAYGTKQQLG